MKVLLSDPDLEWSIKIKSFLALKTMNCEVAVDGKDCQLKLYRGEYDAVVLDLATRNNSGLEVLKYIKLNHPELRIILTVQNQSVLDNLELSLVTAKKLGLKDVIIKPYTIDQLQLSLAENEYSSWKKLADCTPIAFTGEEDIDAADEEFTKIRTQVFCSGNSTIFDHYVRISAGKYIKILHKGESFHPDQIKKYIESRMEFLYFKTSDRGTYLNFMNEMLQRDIELNHVTNGQRIDRTKNMIDKYIEEVYEIGLKPQVIEEGQKICENIYNMVQKDRGLTEMMKTYEDYHSAAHAHLFLTSFISVLICKNLDWSTKRTTEAIALGALLHDIGKLKLPLELREKAVEKMTPEELTLYKLHPQYGMEMLDKFPLINEQVKQIVFQHHEYVDGRGFPNQLTFTKIYPLAKVVSVADLFTKHIIENRMNPLEALNSFLTNKDLIKKCDPAILKGLALSFLNKGGDK